MSYSTISYEEYLDSAKAFVEISERISDGWTLHEESCTNKSYLKKSTFLSHNSVMLKVEYIIFYNLSYGVPSFSFNIWNSSGVLVPLEEVRRMAFLQMDQKDFYSVITQQEHPILTRPYFIMHPCHTEELIKMFKDQSKNIIVTFLGLISPIIKLNLPFEYGL